MTKPINERLIHRLLRQVVRLMGIDPQRYDEQMTKWDAMSEVEREAEFDRALELMRESRRNP